MCWRSLEYHHLRRTLLTDAIREPQVREAFPPDSKSNRSHSRHRGIHLLRNCRLIPVSNIRPLPELTNTVYLKSTLVGYVQSTWTACMLSSVPTLHRLPRNFLLFPSHLCFPRFPLPNLASMCMSLRRNLTGGSAHERRRREGHLTTCYMKTPLSNSGED